MIETTSREEFVCVCVCVCVCVGGGVKATMVYGLAAFGRVGSLKS